jgi:hypothetical protein
LATLRVKFASTGAGCLGGVLLAGQNHLVIPCLEVEHELPVRGKFEFEVAGHGGPSWNIWLKVNPERSGAEWA